MVVGSCAEPMVKSDASFYQLDQILSLYGAPTEAATEMPGNNLGVITLEKSAWKIEMHPGYCFELASGNTERPILRSRTQGAARMAS